MKKKASILEHIEAVAKIFPTPMYWENVDSVILGGNEDVLQKTGALVRERYVGKSLFEIYPYEMAKHIVDHNNEVMRTGQTLSQEETILDMTTKQIKHFKAYKTPIYDDEGNKIGVFGTSIDITAEKEAARLRIELEKSQQSLQDKIQFERDAHQLAHDIRSPVASVLMIMKHAVGLPESLRVGLREAATRIEDIAAQFLTSHRTEESKEEEVSVEHEQAESLLVSSTVLQLLADKKYEYQNLSVRLEDHFGPDGHFAFISIGRSSFKRMLSNLINNARDAFTDTNIQNQTIRVELTADANQVVLHIRDNGKGMPPEVLEKIKKGIDFTAGKKSGHGIGLAQVRDTLASAKAEFNIHSRVDVGTDITLTFPRVAAPEWMGETINLYPDDTIVVLDDDNSIHAAWDGRFSAVLLERPNLQVKHFHHGDEALKFLADLSPAQRNRTFLLSDYELLNQDNNGLQIIQKSELNRFLLVTSHYMDPTVRQEAARVGSKILPKRLASEIPIHFVEEVDERRIHVVLVDDDPTLCSAFEFFIETDDTRAVSYTNPFEFLNAIDQYGKDVIFLLDNSLGPHGITGPEIAAQLHEKGYTRLYLLSGTDFVPGTFPSYLTTLGKMDLDRLKKICSS